MIGLFFFIRASTKDRTETFTLRRTDAPETVLKELIHYFEQRAYTVQSTAADQRQVSLRGLVRPSLFLAVFLSALAAIGFVCLALVLTSLFPSLGPIFLALTLFAPTAGIYYWRRARREEEILLQVRPALLESPDQSSLATITAHRDELIALQQSLKAS